MILYRKKCVISRKIPLVRQFKRVTYVNGGNFKHELLVSSDVVRIAGLVQVHGEGQPQGRLVNLANKTSIIKHLKVQKHEIVS
jgi:hypothetical protein